ncbi:hypothetical protein [Hyphococcus sp.]|uniref:hypothetical protein n=1 Tax=Hyphococcus sp. TaxID=2038636 RepID=UPI003CCBA22A
MISRNGRLKGVAAVCLLFMAGGCAVGPILAENRSQPEIVAERDMLVDAARDVKATPWPKPQPVSIVARIAGAGDDNRVSRSEAVATYVNTLQPVGMRFQKLALDARRNLEAADRLSRIALNASASARVTMNDVVTVEGAIQALRENRKIYTSAAREIEQGGESVDSNEIDVIRTAYADVIRELGRAADALAERVEKDRTETIAARSGDPR